jgi:diguanylate cyclase (GGDEF)-like protein
MASTITIIRARVAQPAGMLLGIGVPLVSLAYASAFLFPSPWHNLPGIAVSNIPLVVAAVIIVRKAGTAHGLEALGWLLLTMALALFFCGNGVYAYYAVVVRSAVPVPGIADALYYAGYIALLGTIPPLMLANKRSSLREWMFDSTLMIFVACTLTWAFLIAPIISSSEDVLARAAAVGYPILDIGLLAGVEVALFASGGRLHPRGRTLALAAGLLILTDLGWSFITTTTGAVTVTSPVQYGHALVYLLWAASTWQSDRPEARPAAPDAVTLLPYAIVLPLVGVYVVALIAGAATVQLSVGVFVGLSLVIGRQFFVIKQHLSSLAHEANHDALTGAFSRHRFEADLEAYCKRAIRQRSQGAVLFIDLDDFKAVNDTLGHRAGDELLVGLVAALRRDVRDGDAIGRMGGDEFGILLAGVDAEEAQAAAIRLRASINSHTLRADGVKATVTASIGIAVIPQHARTGREAVARAGLAMYNAKAAGRNAIMVWADEGDARRDGEMHLNSRMRIREAIERKQFVLYAQPVISFKTGEVYCHELLLRIQEDSGDLILPGAFLPTAEQFGLIREIDRWVIAHAFEVVASHQRDGFDTCVSVNLSASTLGDDQVLAFISQQIAETGVNPSSIVFEITETASIADIGRAAKFMNDLRLLGCRFALDDFGVGFASLFNLMHLPLSYVKIDGAFITNMKDHKLQRQVVIAIVDIARALGLQTVAEYVGDEETARLLREIGVDFGQGFFLGKPEPLYGALSELRARRGSNLVSI